jgi:hypothetical protein
MFFFFFKNHRVKISRALNNCFIGKQKKIGIFYRLNGSRKTNLLAVCNFLEIFLHVHVLKVFPGFLCPHSHAFLFWEPFPGCPVLAVPSWLRSPGSAVLTVLSGCAVLAVLSWMSWDSLHGGWLSYHGCCVVVLS